jgi:hypothetical protein
MNTINGGSNGMCYDPGRFLHPVRPTHTSAHQIPQLARHFSDDILEPVTSVVTTKANTSNRSWYARWLDNTHHFFCAISRKVVGALAASFDWFKNRLKSLGAKVFSLSSKIQQKPSANSVRNLPIVITPEQRTQRLRELASTQIEIQHTLEEALTVLKLEPEEVSDFTQLFYTIEMEASKAADIALKQANEEHARRKASAAATLASLTARKTVTTQRS